MNIVCYNNGMVITYFAVIDNAFIQRQFFRSNFLDERHTFRIDRCNLFQKLRNQRLHICSEVSAVGTRVGYQLVFFVQALCNTQRFLCCIAKTSVGFSLQFGQVKEQRAVFCFTAGIQFGYRSVHTGQCFLHYLRLFFCIQTVDIAAIPHSSQRAKNTLQLIVRLRMEVIYRLLTFHNQGQCRCLYTAHGKLGAVTECEQARKIDAHQPICFAAASCTLIKPLIIFVVF